MTRSPRFRFVLGLLIATALLLTVARFVDLARAAERFDDYRWPNLGIVLLLSLGYFLLKAVRWHYLLGQIDIHLPLRRSVLIYVAGQWFAIAPAGEFVRAYLLTGYGYSFGRGSAAVTAQVVFDFLSLAVIASITVIWNTQLAVLVLPFTCALIFGVLAFALGPRVWGRRSKAATVVGARTRLGGRLASFYLHSRQLSSWQSLTVGLSLALPAVIVGALMLFEVSTGYGIAIGFGQSALIYSLSQLAGALSMLPHGLGAIEGSSVALFQLAGVDPDYAVSAIVLFRLCTVGWGLLLGGISMLALRIPFLAGPIVPPAELPTSTD